MNCASGAAARARRACVHAPGGRRGRGQSASATPQDVEWRTEGCVQALGERSDVPALPPRISRCCRPIAAAEVADRGGGLRTGRGHDRRAWLPRCDRTGQDWPALCRCATPARWANAATCRRLRRLAYRGAAVHREGLPKSLIEAAACGRAVVTTDVPGCRDAIDRQDWPAVPVRDAGALADAIARLAADPALRRDGRGGTAPGRARIQYRARGAHRRSIRRIERLMKGRARCAPGYGSGGSGVPRDRVDPVAGGGICCSAWGDGASSSRMMPRASALPNSTPHWSKD